MNVKLFDAVSMTVKRAVEASNPEYKINDKTYAIIKKDCEEIDILNDEFEFDSFEVLLNEDSNTLTIKIITPDITFNHGRTSPFFSIISHTLRFMFSCESSTDVCVTLVYGNILEV